MRSQTMSVINVRLAIKKAGYTLGPLVPLDHVETRWMQHHARRLVVETSLHYFKPSPVQQFTHS